MPVKNGERSNISFLTRGNEACRFVDTSSHISNMIIMLELLIIFMIWHEERC